MRILLLTVFTLLASISFSQKNTSGILLNTGQKFTVRSTSSQEADMGMGMEMTNNTTSQNKFYVISDDDNNYTISSTLTGLKLSMKFMGQENNYDSDLKEDSASEMGKSIKNLNVPDTILVNKKTAALTLTKKSDSTFAKADDANPMESLFEAFGDSNSDVALTEAFFVMPAGKKAGDSWTDSSSNKDQKTSRTFTIKSIEKGIATIILKGTVISNMQTEENGMQITVSMTTSTDAEIVTDIKTSLVSKRTTKADITGTLELAGQSLPITGKATTTSVYEY